MPPDPNAPLVYVPPMRTSLEYVLGAVCKERGLTRAEFDGSSDDEQVDLLAHYLAEQQITKWQNYREAAALRQRQQQR